MVALMILTALFSHTAESGKWFNQFEQRAWDWRLRWLAEREAPDPKIKIVVVDQSSLDYYAEDGITWPWPRSLYIPVLEFLKAAGARGVAFDILFTESSVHTVHEDEQLAHALGNTAPSVSAVVMSKIARPTNEDKLKLFADRQGNARQNSALLDSLERIPGLPRYKSATLPVEQILKESLAFGNVSADPDSDGVYRHYTLGGLIKGSPILNLPFALHSLAPESRRVVLDVERFLDDERRLTVRFQGGEGAYETVPIADVIGYYKEMLEGKNPRALEEFRDSWVFVGVGAPGLLDLRPTPLAEKYKGVEYIATVLDNFIHGDFIIKTNSLTNVLYGLIAVSLAATAVLFSSRLSFQVLYSAAMFLALLVVNFSFLSAGYWLPLIVPSICLVVSLLIAFIFQYELEGRQHKFIRDAFSHYVSPDVIDQIVVNPESLALGGERRIVTAFFSDLEGFTALSEALDPKQLVQLLNEYLTEMTDIILEFGGTLDKYEGDAIIAFWNAPLALSDHAERAVRAAIASRHVLESMRPRIQERYNVDLRLRLGINTGLVTVGNFGSRNRFDYTMIGDAVNLASRIEGVNKFFQTDILISEYTYQEVGEIAPMREVGDVRVVGKQEAVRLYEPLPDNYSEEHRNQYHKALKLFKKLDWRQALQEFQEVADDPVARKYQGRIEQWIATGAPELVQGDVVWNMDNK